MKLLLQYRMLTLILLYSDEKVFLNYYVIVPYKVTEKIAYYFIITF